MSGLAWPKLRFILLGLTAAGIVLALLFTLAAPLGDHFWLADVVSHFRIQYLVCLAAALLVCGVLRSWLWFGLAAVTFAINLWVVYGTLLGPSPIQASERPSISVLVWNLYGGNQQTDEAVAWLLEQEADVIVLLEVNSRLRRALKPLETHWPHVLEEIREDHFGIAAFARKPFRGGEILHAGFGKLPSTYFRYPHDGRELSILGTHPLPPGRLTMWRKRNDQFRELSRIVKEDTIPVILVGDLNATPWCPSYQALLSQSGLRDSGVGSGYQRTWRPQSFLFGIPIDHAFYSPELHLQERWVGPNIGSDHSPVFVRLAFP